MVKRIKSLTNCVDELANWCVYTHTPSSYTSVLGWSWFEKCESNWCPPLLIFRAPVLLIRSNTVEDPGCTLCRSVPETIYHLMWNCNKDRPRSNIKSWFQSVIGHEIFSTKQGIYYGNWWIMNWLKIQHFYGV